MSGLPLVISLWKNPEKDASVAAAAKHSGLGGPNKRDAWSYKEPIGSC